MSVYQSASNPAPDSDYEPGSLDHLVVGNAGRLLDPRRTPVSVVGLRPDVGSFVVRIEDFEDKGAVWEIPYEMVDRYQFARDCQRAAPPDVEGFRRAIELFDQELTISCDEQTRTKTLSRLEEQRQAAAAWLETGSSFFAEAGHLPPSVTRDGDPRLCRDLREFMVARDLWDLDEAFARQYVRNPYSGELVKGHRIVIAELGLVPFEGTIVRDPGLFDEPWSRRHRVEHVLARLAFVHAVFTRLGKHRLTLHRGLSTEGPMKPPDNRTFVSATFSRDVALSHFESGSFLATRTLVSQAVPVERVFMTYFETAAMNEHYREAEAVLFVDKNNLSF
jgi:hypothetical protein